MDEIYTLLEGLRPDSDFRASEDFMQDYLLDSFDIISLTAELEEKYGIKIQTDDIVPENFQSADTIKSLVCKCGGDV